MRFLRPRMRDDVVVLLGVRQILGSLALGLFAAFAAAVLLYIYDRTLVSSGFYYLANILILFLVAILQLLIRVLFSRPVGETPVPDLNEAKGLTDAMKAARRSLCAVSSKPLALWESPTFTYYLMVQGVKTVVEFCRRSCSGIEAGHGMSIGNQNGAEYRAEEAALLESLAQGGAPQGFFSLRILVYPSTAYRARGRFFEKLIELHRYFRVHCIPLVLEDLVKWMNRHATDQENHRLRTFAIRTGCAEDNPCPDFLMVDLGAETEGVALEHDKRAVWWYVHSEGRTDIEARPRIGNETIWDESKASLALLCRAARECRWPNDSSLGQGAEFLGLREPVGGVAAHRT